MLFVDFIFYKLKVLITCLMNSLQRTSLQRISLQVDSLQVESLLKRNSL
jgi:hypothetical protein